jgi:hypothetical protein
MDRAILKGAPQGTERTKVIFVYLVAARKKLISRALALVASGRVFRGSGKRVGGCVW